MKKTEPTATPPAAPTNDQPSSLEDFWGPEMLAATERNLVKYQARQARIRSLIEDHEN